jgi:hypothetical protein
VKKLGAPRQGKRTTFLRGIVPLQPNGAIPRSSWLTNICGNSGDRQGYRGHVPPVAINLEARGESGGIPMSRLRRKASKGEKKCAAGLGGVCAEDAHYWLFCQKGVMIIGHIIIRFFELLAN